MEKIEKIKKEVFNLLNNDDSGHGMDHINRVLKLSLKFAEKENADKYIVALIALLHDVDDYKLFGEENAKNLPNARYIMKSVDIPDEIQNKVLSSLECIGYSKSLKGIRPTTIEGKIVSDADMCDAMGVNGIIRTNKYSKKNGKPFFDRNIFPVEDITDERYKRKCSDSSVCHMFEKLLKLKGLMMTESGMMEAKERHQIMIDILYHLFDEENAPEWREYLDAFLNKHYGSKQL